jgi:outer membrane protein
MKYLIIGISILWGQCVFAQTPTDGQSVSINGTVNFSKEKLTTDDDLNPFYKNTTISLNPQVGYFIIDNFSIGLLFSYRYHSYEDEDYEYSTEVLGVGPVIRYYLVSDKFSPFTTIGYTYATVFDDNDESDYGSNIWSIGLGLDYFVSSSIAVEGIISYFIAYNESSFQDITYKSETNTFGIGIGLNLFL